MTNPDIRVVQLLREARETLESERKRRRDPIAIVGIGCRLPGGAASPAAFWQLMVNGVDATNFVPGDRWDADALFDPDPKAAGKCYSKRGAFLDRIDGFEPAFFGISPREAAGLDPQQRLLLEVTWEALEDAGIVPDTLRGSATGVWIGSSLDDYSRRCMPAGQLELIDAYNALGNSRSVAAGRIAYVLGLQGPVLQLDTACSSSLVAVHLACASLRAGETEVALVGGVSLMSSPEASVALSRMMALSPDGRCKTFDAAADGYGRGEGCGIVVLKRLSDAQLAGDRIYAVVRGSAVNHDGRSNGLTAPNGVAQEAVIRTALKNADVQASAVGYVEAHGTGTLLGDPIEVMALNRVYGAARSTETPLYVGSVKTNVGHLEAAAGVAALIKVALCVQHGRLVRSLHFNTPNPKIPWSGLAVRVTSEAALWPGEPATRLAGLSSFGISGTNAHVLVEQAPDLGARSVAPARSAELVVLSARTEPALRAVAERLCAHLASRPELALADVARSLLTSRALFDHRLALAAPTLEWLCGALAAFARDEPLPPAGYVGQARKLPSKTAWLFAGQGAQKIGMGQSLYREWPAFREALDLVFAQTDRHLDRPLREVMWGVPGTPEAELLDQTAYTQPALFAFGWALSALWRSWGIEPDFVAGHSVGEVTAACVAGVFSLEDAARLICERGRLMQALPSGGAMLSIAADERVVSECISEHPSLNIAAVNAPSSFVISGPAASVTLVAAELAARGVSTQRLNVSCAGHSSLVEPMLIDFLRVARTVAYRPAAVPLVSNLTGQLAPRSVSTAEYWVRQVREPVLFAAVAAGLAAAGVETFLELGPRVTLVPLVAASLEHQAQSDPQSWVLLASGRKDLPECQSVLHALAGWVSRGGHADWGAVLASGAQRTDLPTYPWQRQSYWIERSHPGELTGDDRPASKLEAAPIDPPALGMAKHDLSTRSVAERLAVAVELVKREVGRALALSDPDALPLDTPLVDLGLDSLMATELRSALNRHAGRHLSAAYVHQHATARAIAGVVLQGVAPSTNATGSSLSTNELALTLVGDGPALKAVFCKPEGHGPFPTAVFVPGSGPLDVDGTAGGVSLFADLARDLVHRGIASLRFEKRAFAHPELIDPRTVTVEQEIVEDAVRAVQLSLGQDAVDKHRVFIVGHSLGALLAPEVAARSGGTAGLVLLAPPGRSLLDLAVAQLERKNDRDPELVRLRTNAQQLRSGNLRDDARLLGVSGVYFNDLARRDTVALSRVLKLPLLIVRGTLDEDVAERDIAVWRHATEPGLARYLSLPGLTHLFIGAAAAGGRVDGSVAEAIAVFITER